MNKKKSIILLIFIILIEMLCIVNKNTYVQANDIVYSKNIAIGTTQYGSGYIYGNIESDIQPKMILKSTDEKVKKDVYIQKIAQNQYYFDRHFVEMDLSKEYVFEITKGNATSTLNLGSNRVLGNYNIYKVVNKDNKISIAKDEYEGIPNVNLKSFNLGTTQYGARYVYGTIEYTESINRSKKIFGSIT